jgi:spermidine synthase
MRYSQLKIICIALFFFSGISALIYEVTWVRLLSLSFGVSVYAVSAVLTAFMGGLALGSWLFGRVAARIEGDDALRDARVVNYRLLRLYGFIQLGIGACALLSPVLFALLTNAYVWAYNQFEPSFYVFNVLRFGLAALVLLVPACLMGGTLPVLGQLLARHESSRGGDLGALYAANTAGAVIGTALAGLVLIRAFGTNATVFIAAGIDIVIAAATFWLSFSPITFPLPRQPQQQPGRRKPRKDAKAREAAAATATAPFAITPAQQRLVLAGFALSGFAALGYQVVWARLLAIFTMNAVFSFAIMLTVFLAGLALGGWLLSGAVNQLRRPLALFGALQLAIGLCGVLVLYIFAKLYTLLDLFTAPANFGALVYAEFFAAAVTLFVPTVLMGATFPLAARIYGVTPTTSDELRVTSGQPAGSKPESAAGNDGNVAPSTRHSSLVARHSVGARVGRLYSLNTLGAMLGSCAAGFVLIPLIGLQWSALTLALVNLGVGTAALLAAPGSQRLALGGAWAVAVVAALLLPPGVYLGFREGAIPQLKFYREGADATVAVFQVDSPPLKISFVNGRNEVPTDPDSMQAFYMLGHLPPLLRPEARSALMVSFGNGIATGTMSRHGISRIHAVELVAEQVEAAQLYTEENHNVLAYPGLSITIEDGRNYLLRSPEQFDIITADATHPVNTSSWALFTREFYTLTQQHLAPGGVFVQWLPFHDLSQRDYRDIVRTFQSVFPHTTLWYTGGTHTFLVGTPEALTRAQVEAMAQRLKEAGFAGDFGDEQKFAGDFLMDEAAVARYAAEGRVVTDDSAFFIPSMDRDAIRASFEEYREAAR